jgi:hypothetical protein
MSNVYEMSRGDTKTFTGIVRDKAGATVDLTGAQITFVVFDLAGAIVLTKKSQAGGGNDTQIEIPDQVANGGADEGKYKLKIGAADSNLAQTARWANCWVVTATERIEVDEHAPFYIHGEALP